MIAKLQNTAPRISPAEALQMLREGDTAELMGRADAVRRQLHGDVTYFTHSLNINPTNLCKVRCALCAFWRDGAAPDAYIQSLEKIREQLSKVRNEGLTDLHIVGGLWDDMDLAYHEALFKLAKEILPTTLVQGLTAVEIHDLAQRSGLGLEATLRRLQAAGLEAVPGGGAEIFAPAVRKRICPKKCNAAEWLAVHEQAHALGIGSNATMLFGHIESLEDIVDHLTRLRDQQDRSGGFQAFIALPFQTKGTKLKVTRGVGGYPIARVVAVARLFLDNFPHVRVLVNYMDRKLIQALLFGGVDDIGGTSLDERIARAAGAAECQRFTSVEEVENFISDLGLTPRLVNSLYQEPAAAPKHRAVAVPAPRRVTASGKLEVALQKAKDGQRLSAEEAVALHDEADWQQLADLAHQRRLQQVPGRLATFVMDRNISTTNICETGCKFCAFYSSAKSPKAFSYTIEELVATAVESAAQGATQILLQGGLNPEFDLAFYERLLAAIRARLPNLCLHSLSPTEINFFARQEKLPVQTVLERLRAAGLDSLPGGGAEILVDAVRQRISPRKLTADQWFEVMETAQRMGMKTTATMVYGLGETTAQRVEHLARVRDVQDRYGGFTAFIPWSFQPNHTQLKLRAASGVDYLRIVALARLVLDNVPHLQAGWVTEGPELAQLALVCGADDFGGVLMEEKVVRATGVSYNVAADQVVALIAQTGFTPAQRTTQYGILRVHDRAPAPATV
ncbi:MAG: dehypoxanthine futalosine cyclase [Verrucomicrobia bacterium]|nr:MAG: dehypoxanthine futalosine cyclase [Verrucomicrobiota bacterium]